MGTAFGLDATFVEPAPQPGGGSVIGKNSDALDGLWAVNRLNGRSVI